jgi:hypothetical protein
MLVPAVRAQKPFVIFASLSDKSGAPVSGATAENFRVLEDGIDAAIVKVDPVTWPLKLQILVDNGTGMGAENLGQLRTSLRGLLEALPPATEVTVVTTSPQPRFLQRATTDRNAQLQAVDRLAPDQFAGQFISSLSEALQRVERDKSDHFPVVLTIGTTVGEANPREQDATEITRRLQARGSTVVHAVIVSAAGASVFNGANQVEVGLAATRISGGRYENINSTSRLAAVLAELGGQMAKSFGPSSGRYRLTVQRPEGKTGELGRLSFGTRGGLVATDVTVSQ